MLLAQPLQAQVPLVVMPETPTVEPGDTVAVAVDVGAAAALYGVGLRLTFPNAAFEVVSVARGALFASYAFDGLTPEALDFVRLVRPEDDLDSDGTADGVSFLAYSVTLLRPTPALYEQGGAVVTVRLRARPEAVRQSYALGLEQTAVQDSVGVRLAVQTTGATVEVRAPVRAAPAVMPAFVLGPPVPDPFEATTMLALLVDRAQAVHAAAYDALGRRVAVLFDGIVGAGEQVTLRLDGAGLPPGVLFVRVLTEDGAETRTVVRR